MTKTEKMLFNAVIRELQSFAFNTTNLIDDLSTTETEREKEKVQNKILTLLQTLK